MAGTVQGATLRRASSLPRQSMMLEGLDSFLIVGGTLSAIAALLHLGIIVGGAPWYRFFGAGERMARACQAGRWYPAIVTTGIVVVLAAWSACAFSAAGLMPPLPLLRPALVLITAVYLLRGLAILPLLTFARSRSTPFLIWSSLICLGFGVIHAIGLVRVWDHI